jgi:hypothetical protein
MFLIGADVRDEDCIVSYAPLREMAEAHLHHFVYNTLHICCGKTDALMQQHHVT